MKNRILSFVLAVVMVFAMIPAVAIGSNAADGLGIKISLSNYTVAPGGTAYVDLYASVDNLAGNDGLCNFQVYFDLPEGVTIAETGYTIYSEGTKGVKSTVNVTDKMIAATADAGEYLVMLDQLTAKGGALLATVAFNVTGSASEYEIKVTKVSDFAMRSEEGDIKPSDADLAAIDPASGKITVATVATGVADANDETLDRYDSPEYNSKNEKVVSVVGLDMDTWEDYTQSGTYGTLFVPSTVKNIASDGFDGTKATVTEALILKNTEAYTDGAAGILTIFRAGVRAKTPPTIYYHKRTNRADTMYDSLAGGLPAAYLKNIMSAGAVIAGEGDTKNVTFYGNIVVEDVKYQDVFVEAVLTNAEGEDRIFTTEDKENPGKNRYVYTTLTSGETVLVTTDEAVSVAGGTYVDGAYLFGGVINNVPAEVLSTLRVTAYGRTWDANGNLIYVCSDVWTPAA